MKFQIIVSVLLLASTAHGLALKLALAKKLAVLPAILQSGGGAISSGGDDGDIGGDSDSDLPSDPGSSDGSGSSDSSGSSGSSDMSSSEGSSRIVYYIPEYTAPVYYTTVRQVRRPVVYVRSTRRNGGLYSALGNLVSTSARAATDIQSRFKGVVGNLLNQSSSGSTEVYYAY